jgi:hypothetical protein
VEYLKKMGMKEYENGTVIFYEDETDVKKTIDTEQSTEVPDYDADLIYQMFESSGEKPIRISREYKDQDFNQSSFINRSLLKNMELGDSLTDLANLAEPDLDYENEEKKKPTAGKRGRKNDVLEYFEPIIRKKENLKKGDTV